MPSRSLHLHAKRKPYLMVTIIHYQYPNQILYLYDADFQLVADRYIFIKLRTLLMIASIYYT